MLRILCVSSLVVVSVGLLSAAVDGDPVKDRLNLAKKAYANEIKKFGEEAGEYFDKRESAARERGDKKQVDAVKADRFAFESKGELPKGAPFALKKRADAAHATLMAEYEAAIKAYTKARKDAEAEDVEKEMNEFRLIRMPVPAAAAKPAVGVKPAPAKPGEKATWLAGSKVIDARDWVEPRKAAFKVTPDGHLQLSNFESRLVTKKADFTNAEIRVKLSATKGTTAYVALGLDGRRPVTSGIVDSGEDFKLGGLGRNFGVEQSSESPAFAYGESFEVKIRYRAGIAHIFIDGKRTSILRYLNDKLGEAVPGAAGIILKKGSVTIESLEVSEIE